MATITKKKLIQTISTSKGLHPNDVRNVIQAVGLKFFSLSLPF